MLEFLNPFLWGLSFSLIPIIIYIYKFSRRKNVILPTLDLLEENKRSRGFSLNVEFLKLFLRVLMIVIIVLIFSQPYIYENRKDKILVILDTTYSSKGNFESYLRYLKEYLVSIPSGKIVKILDLEGNEIVGTPKDVMEKIKFYFPKVGKIEKNFFSKLSQVAGESEVIVLTDGQKSFVDNLNKFGIKGKIVNFPFTFPYGKVSFSIWKRVGSEIHVNYEVDVREECLFEVFLDVGNSSKMLLSSVVFGRKVGEMKVNSSTEGIGFIRGILVNGFKTNEFVEPVYFFKGGFDLVLECSNAKFIENALKVLDFYVTKGSRYKIVVGNIVNSDNFRDSIIVPCSPESKIFLRGSNIFSSKGGYTTTYESGNTTTRKFNFSSFSILPYTNFFVPLGSEVYEFGNTPVFVYDRDKNNVLVLGEFNYKDYEFPWFLKEIIEFLFVYSKTEIIYPYGEFASRVVSISDNKYRVLIVPDEEISSVIESSFYGEKKRYNFLSFLLFAVFVIVVIVERIIST